jgi:hypothetical protein
MPTRPWFPLLPAALLLAACAPAPVEFLDVRVEAITHQTALVRFRTEVPVSCEVEYGLSANELHRTSTHMMAVDGPMHGDHEIELTGLAADTAYAFRLVVDQDQGRTQRTQVRTFTTLPIPQAGAPNVALRSAGTSVVAVSSNFGGGDHDSTWGAHRAIDGDLGTEWATHGNGDGAFLILDLGQPRTLAKVAFRSRSMADGTAIITAFRLILDGVTVLGPFDAPDAATRYEYELTSPTTAQQVRFEAVATTGGNTGAKELELYE